MLMNDNVVDALVRANDDALNILLQKAGIDIYAVGATDQMTTLLILLSLLTCLAGIINSMLMAVTERVREIGTLKCLGALDGFIVQNYLIESTIQGLVGTLIGLVVGLAVAILILVNTYGTFVFQHFPWLLTFRTMLLAFGIGVVLSVVASILPAYWAARMQPVDAMRVQE
jgi:putative ABC transport system permease protein